MISNSPGKEPETICDECEKSIPSFYCNECEQNLCFDCDKRIHNKGARKSHKRIPMVKQSLQEEVQSESVVSKIEHDISSNTSIEVSSSHSGEELKAISMNSVPFLFNGKNNTDKSCLNILEEREPSNKEDTNIGIKLDLLLKKLYELANEGRIILEINELEKVMKGLTHEEYTEVIKEGKSKNKIVVLERNFGTKFKQKLVGLKFQEPSFETLMWILKSLEKDAIKPKENVIIGRYKEAFGVEMKKKRWDVFWNTIKKRKRDCEFDVWEEKDPIKKCETHLIYPKGHKWKDFDTSLELTDIDQTLYKETINFLKSCFLNKSDENYFQEQRCPGGHYGCTQFIKTCGPPHLKNCLLGQLLQFVKRAAETRILGHNGTYLIWNEAPPESASNSKTREEEGERSYNLESIKTAKSIKKKQKGIYKKDLNVNENSNERVMVNRYKDPNEDLKNIRAYIFYLLLNHPSGINVNDLCHLIKVHSKIDVNSYYPQLRCQDLCQFIMEYIQPYVPIEFTSTNFYDSSQLTLRLKFSPEFSIINNYNEAPPRYEYSIHQYNANPKIHTANKKPLAPEYPSTSYINLSTISTFLYYFSTSSTRLHCLLC